MLAWSAKAPSEQLDYDIDWTARLNGDTISSSSWAIVAGDAPTQGALTIVQLSNSFTASVTKVVVSGGNPGITYTLVNSITTASGDTAVESVQLPVQAAVAATNILTTMANALQWLGASSDPNGSIARIIEAVSVEIQNWLGYNILQSSYSRTFDGNGVARFFVPDLPLVSVQSLSIDGAPIPMGVPGQNAVGFYNNSQSINLIGYRFCRGFQNISASYTAGYTTVPPDIEQACLDWSKNIFISGSMPIPTNVVSVSAGDTSFNFGGAGSVTDPAKLPMPAAISLILMNYRRVAQISGW